jgi:hypothetical protein
MLDGRWGYFPKETPPEIRSAAAACNERLAANSMQ